MQDLRKNNAMMVYRECMMNRQDIKFLFGNSNVNYRYNLRFLRVSRQVRIFIQRHSELASCSAEVNLTAGS